MEHSSARRNTTHLRRRGRSLELHVEQPRQHVGARAAEGRERHAAAGAHQASSCSSCWSSLASRSSDQVAARRELLAQAPAHRLAEAPPRRHQLPLLLLVMSLPGRTQPQAQRSDAAASIPATTLPLPLAALPLHPVAAVARRRAQRASLRRSSADGPGAGRAGRRGGGGGADARLLLAQAQAVHLALVLLLREAQHVRQVLLLPRCRLGRRPGVAGLDLCGGGGGALQLRLALRVRHRGQQPALRVLRLGQRVARRRHLVGQHAQLVRQQVALVLRHAQLQLHGGGGQGSGRGGGGRGGRRHALVLLQHQAKQQAEALARTLLHLHARGSAGSSGARRKEEALDPCGAHLLLHRLLLHLGRVGEHGAVAALVALSATRSGGLQLRRAREQRRRLRQIVAIVHAPRASTSRGRALVTRRLCRRAGARSSCGLHLRQARWVIDRLAPARGLGAAMRLCASAESVRLARAPRACVRVCFAELCSHGVADRGPCAGCGREQKRLPSTRTAAPRSVKSKPWAPFIA